MTTDRKSSRVDNFTTRDKYIPLRMCTVYYLLVKKRKKVKKRCKKKKRANISIEILFKRCFPSSLAAASSSPAAATAQTHKSRR